jgi:hypothetical protein
MGMSNLAYDTEPTLRITHEFLYLSILLQLVLKFIFSCLPSTMQQYQYFKIHHCTTCFGLLGHHHVR